MGILSATVPCALAQEKIQLGRVTGTLSVILDGDIQALTVLNADKQEIEKFKWGFDVPLVRTYEMSPGLVWLSLPSGSPAYSIAVDVPEGGHTFVRVGPVEGVKAAPGQDSDSISITVSRGSPPADFTTIVDSLKMKGLESFLKPVSLEQPSKELYFDTEPPWPIPPRPGSPTTPPPQ